MDRNTSRGYKLLYLSTLSIVVILVNKCQMGKYHSYVVKIVMK